MQTKKLKDILKTLSDVIKADKTRPITTLMSLVAEDGVCYLGATDLHTNIVARIECPNDIASTTVSLPNMYRLVKSFKEDEINITRKGNYLDISCGGMYKIPAELDIDGTEVNLPIKIDKKDELIDLPNVKNVSKRNSLAVGEDILQFYHFNNGKVISSDTDILASTNYEVPIDVPYYIITKLVALGDNIKAHMTNTSIYAKTNDYAFSATWDNLGEYPTNLVEHFDNLPTTATIPKNDLLDIVKRFSSIKKQNIIFMVENNHLNIYDLDMTIKEPLEFEGTLEDITIVFDTNKLLKILRVMEKVISFSLYPKFIWIVDSLGSYALTGGSNE